MEILCSNIIYADLRDIYIAACEFTPLDFKGEEIHITIKMNLTNELRKSDWETLSGGDTLSDYRSCIWIPSTQTILYTTTDIESPRNPMTFGTFDLDEKVLSSLTVHHENCQNILNIAYLNHCILICCYESLNILSLRNFTIKPLMSPHHSLSCLQFGAFHPDGTIWFTAKDNNGAAKILRLNPRIGDPVQISFALLETCGLVQPHYIRWSSDGNTCYVTCSVKLRVYSASYDPVYGLVKARVFSYLPITQSIVGLDCDPFDNVVVATRNTMFFWDRYGHFLAKLDYVNDIVDFALSDHEIVLMHRSHWSKLKTEFHRRSIPDDHLISARV